MEGGWDDLIRIDVVLEKSFRSFVTRSWNCEVVVNAMVVLVIAVSSSSCDQEDDREREHGYFLHKSTW